MGVPQPAVEMAGLAQATLYCMMLTAMWSRHMTGCKWGKQQGVNMLSLCHRCAGGDQHRGQQAEDPRDEAPTGAGPTTASR
jgi:hypothetical protein